ncbi:MAG: hypothetical protein GY856_20700 [bacterium]|nr:hypothetical protein [bacterium]
MNIRTTCAVVFFAALGVLAGGPLAGQQPGAFEMLAEVRKAYEELGVYRDRGEIEILDRTGSTVTARHLRFETVVDGEDSFRLMMQSMENPGAERRVLWRSGDEVFLIDVALGQYRRLSSLAAGIPGILDPGGFDALVVVGLLAGSSEALATPEAAAVEEGEKRCGRSVCHLLSLSRMSGTIETKLWIDRESSLIRQLEVVFRPANEGFATLLSESGLSLESGTAKTSVRSTTIWVEHKIAAVDEPLDPEVVAAGLPDGVRLVEEWEIPADGGAADSGYADQDLVFTDEISVALSTLVVRVVDKKGNPLLGLKPEDFRVSASSGEVPVTAADWVSSDPAHRDEVLIAKLAEAGVQLEPTEKLVVFFVQSAMQAVRIRGHLRTLPHVQELVGVLQPNDRAAVVSFDSHLKLWQDFTRRHDDVSGAIERAIGFGAKPQLQRSGELSLAEHFDFRAAKHAGTPEEALDVLGQALTSIAGEKTMIYLGWGLGRYGRGGVGMSLNYTAALRTLEAARTTVFVLDVTDAGSHSLEVGLKNIAAQTGGTYDRTNQFTEQVTMRLARTISGYYVLMLDTSQMADPNEPVRTELRKKKGRVLTKPY